MQAAAEMRAAQLAEQRRKLEAAARVVAAADGAVAQREAAVRAREAAAAESEARLAALERRLADAAAAASHAQKENWPVVNVPPSSATPSALAATAWSTRPSKPALDALEQLDDTDMTVQAATALAQRLRSVKSELGQTEVALRGELRSAALIKAEADDLRGRLAAATEAATQYARVLDTLRVSGAWDPSSVPALAAQVRASGSLERAAQAAAASLPLPAVADTASALAMSVRNGASILLSPGARMRAVPVIEINPAAADASAYDDDDDTTLANGDARENGNGLHTHALLDATDRTLQSQEHSSATSMLLASLDAVANSGNGVPLVNVARNNVGVPAVGKEKDKDGQQQQQRRPGRTGSEASSTAAGVAAAAALAARRPSGTPVRIDDSATFSKFDGDAFVFRKALPQ